MESYDFIDSIKVEKANALARYRTFSNIMKLFQLLEVFAAVAVVSWSSSHLPLVFKLSGEYVTAFSSYLTNQHVVFLVGNLIVVVCYVLSRNSDSGTDSGGFDYHYDCRLTHRKTNSDGVNPKLFPSSEIQKVQIPVSLNTAEVAGEAVILPEMKRIERFQRTRSEKVKRRIPVKAERELRRSVTEMRRNVTVRSGGNEAVEKLSNEEFRMAVESFILKQQRLLKEQSMMVEG